METISKKHLEKGYGMFPYLIIRWYPTVYQQIPIHRMPYNEQLEGIFVAPEQEEEWGYPEALLQLLRKIWWYNRKNQKDRRFCLVLNPEEAYFIDQEGEFHKSEPPSGGLLLDKNGKIFLMYGQHYADIDRS